MAQEGFHHRPAQLPCPRPQGLLEDRAGALPQGCPCPRIRHRPRPRVSVPSLPVNKPHLYPSALTAPSVAPSGLSGGGGAPGELIVSWTVSRGDRGRVCLRFSGGTSPASLTPELPHLWPAAVCRADPDRATLHGPLKGRRPLSALPPLPPAGAPMQDTDHHRRTRPGGGRVGPGG